MSSPAVIDTPVTPSSPQVPKISPESLPALAPVARCPVIVEERVLVPGWIQDVLTFRNWVDSEDFPAEGAIAFLGNHVWLDLTMEELFTHNRVKAAFALVLLTLARDYSLGSFVLDRMRFTNPDTNLSTEPDGLFHTWEAIRLNRLRYVEGRLGGIVELEGTAEMVLEIVSATSVVKDTVTLLDLYYRAGVQEYWLADARGDEPKFTIYRRGTERFEEQPGDSGWQTSALFARAFRLERTNDPLGNAQFVVNLRT